MMSNTELICHPRYIVPHRSAWFDKAAFQERTHRLLCTDGQYIFVHTLPIPIDQWADWTRNFMNPEGFCKELKINDVIESVKFADRKPLLAIFDYDNTVSVWHYQSKSVVCHVPAEFNAPQMLFCRNDTALIIGDWGENGYEIAVVNFSNPRTVKRYKAGHEHVFAVSPVLDHFAYATDQETLRVVQLFNDKVLHELYLADMLPKESNRKILNICFGDSDHQLGILTQVSKSGDHTGEDENEWIVINHADGHYHVDHYCKIPGSFNVDSQLILAQDQLVGLNKNNGHITHHDLRAGTFAEGGLYDKELNIIGYYSLHMTGQGDLWGITDSEGITRDIYASYEEQSNKVIVLWEIKTRER